MQKNGLNEIREKFLSFFESKDHLRLKSFSLVPVNDKSLLIINSGMAPLKPYFTGDEVPPRRRITTCQKCIRTPDIDNVGLTARHGTFFEMLGDFSFGDYFKNEIIPWSWEFCTEVMGLDPEKLYVTVYQDDDEAEKIWHEKVGVPMEHISRLGKEDNFWEHGTGPCGPCSEIYYDRGIEYGCGKDDCKPGCDCDRFVEFWNLVFSQFDRQEDGSYEDLIQKNIDTGMGLERLAVIMQDVDNIFEVDTIRHILDYISEISGTEYGKDDEKDVSIRVITDHIRSVTFMIADGIMPSNEGRGYVLRRLLRRAIRHGKKLGLNKPFLADVAKKVMEASGDAYPELKERIEYIQKIINIEETNFNQLLDQGLELIDDYIQDLKEKNQTIFPGELAFKLYDTFGFPLDLTKDILNENNLELDQEGFDNAMQEQKERARKAREDAKIAVFGGDPFGPLGNQALSEFNGYDHNTASGELIGIVKDGELVEKVSPGDEVILLIDQVPFYAESGGQTADTGLIRSENGLIEVSDVQKGSLGRHIIYGNVKEGDFSLGQSVFSEINIPQRRATERNHTSTHLLQKALKMVLGDHVHQKGSFVSEERLRFDFNHYEPMTDEEIKAVEKIVNEKILEALDVSASQMPIDEAKELGAEALFGEKYGDIVRVIQAGDFSAELCGGCHVKNTGTIGLFKIISESSVAAGVRRIEAVTGLEALNYINHLENIIDQAAHNLKTSPDKLNERIDQVNLSLKEKDETIKKLSSKQSGNLADELINQAKKEDNFNILVTQVKGLNAKALRELSDKIRDKLKNPIILLASVNDDKISFLANVCEEAIKKGVKAGQLVKSICEQTGGRGGGKDQMAQGGGKDISQLDQALENSFKIITQDLK